MADDQLIRAIGLQYAQQTKKRIRQMQAASTLFDYLGIGLGKPHLLKADKSGLYGVDITGNFRIIFRPVPDTKQPDVNTSTEIEIIGVCDYHGGKDNWIIP